MSRSGEGNKRPEFHRVLRLDNGAVLGIVDLSSLDGLDGLEDHFLTPFELSLCRELRNPKRRREWLGARIALKMLLQLEDVVGQPDECEIRKDGNGRPYLCLTENQRNLKSVDCSLSHKGDYALAALTKSTGMAIGADLEKVSPRLSRLRSQFINEKDSLLARLDEDAYHTVIFCLKEAASKSLGLGLRAGLTNLACQEEKNNFCRITRARGGPLEAKYFFLDDHVAAVAWISSDR